MLVDWKLQCHLMRFHHKSGELETVRLAFTCQLDMTTAQHGFMRFTRLQGTNRVTGDCAGFAYVT